MSMVYYDARLPYANAPNSMLLNTHQKTEKLQEEFDTSIKELKSSLKSARTLIESQEKQISRLESSLDSRDYVINKLNTKLEDRDAQVSQLKLRLDQAKQEIARLNQLSLPPPAYQTPKEASAPVM